MLNDTFFMPLLFFVSGLFVWRSLERKGVAGFLLGRLTRLGIPFRADGPFAKRWWAWLLAWLLSYGGLTLVFASAPQSPLARYIFVVEMALAVLGLTAVFVRFARRHVPILDSLSANSYGIYIIHYLVVIWLQYAALGVDLPAVVKGAIVFFGGLALCWGLIAVLRRIRAVARII